jgi:hypothetical protein
MVFGTERRTLSEYASHIFLLVQQDDVRIWMRVKVSLGGNNSREPFDRINEASRESMLGHSPAPMTITSNSCDAMVMKSLKCDRPRHALKLPLFCQIVIARPREAQYAGTQGWRGTVYGRRNPSTAGYTNF